MLQVAYSAVCAKSIFITSTINHFLLVWAWISCTFEPKSSDFKLYCTALLHSHPRRTALQSDTSVHGCLYVVYVLPHHLGNGKSCLSPSDVKLQCLSRAVLWCRCAPSSRRPREARPWRAAHAACTDANFSKWQCLTIGRPLQTSISTQLRGSRIMMHDVG